MAAAVQSSCREAYTKLLLPGLNALTQQIFAQVNENFSRGTRECEWKKSHLETRIYWKHLLSDMSLLCKICQMYVWLHEQTNCEVNVS